MEDIIQEIENDNNLSLDRSFELAQICSGLLKSDEKTGRKLVINILNNWNKLHPATSEIWTDLVEAAGFYPYLQKNKSILKFKNIYGELRKENHLSENLDLKYFHDEQFVLLQLLRGNKNVIVSAPTSFGKSLLIEEVIASYKYQNIVVIQPTLALLDETRRKLLKYDNNYKLIVRTSQEPSKEKGNIFLFTAERVNEYQFFPRIEYLIIDEFYKLSGNRDDERSSSLNNAFYFLLKTFSPKFYLLGPNIDGISAGFAEKYNAEFYKSDYSLVDSKTVDIYLQHIGLFGDRGAKKRHKEDVLFTLLLDILIKNEQTIIYCSSPNRVRYLAKAFVKYLKSKDRQHTENKYPLSEWIKKYVYKDWCLLEYLNFDIGIHDGALQKHISTSIIDYFNTGKLKFLFCTSTIIEGVNTSAKNIIYFDSKKGPNDVDFFDYSNIKGRAGRMMEHYVGKIYNFNVPPNDQPIIIDIPFFQQNPIKDEVLIQIEEQEVINSESSQYISISSLPENERKLIKNNGANVRGQKSIIDKLRSNLPNDHDLIDWVLPTYPQLTYVLSLAWDYLIVPGETTAPMTKDRLVKMTFDYGLNQDINYLIRNNYSYNRKLERNKDVSDNDLRDIAIQETFQIMKHWFEYKVPKWLSVINEIQRFLCAEKGLHSGSYAYYANLIENDFLRQNLSILAEYGVPSSAIRLIEENIPEDLDQDNVLKYIKQNDLFNLPNLIEYERIKLKENIN